MKHLALILCIAGMPALTGYVEEDFDFRGGGPAVSNLQAFVLNNCNQAKPKPFAPPVPIATGASFPPPQVANPANSVYTRQCLRQFGR